MKRFSILKQPILSTINDHLIDYPSPSNLNYFWNFESLAGLYLNFQIAIGIFFAIHYNRLYLNIQIAIGIFLAIHYTSHVDLAFLSVEHIMRDVGGEWLLRYMDANGAAANFCEELPNGDLPQNQGAAPLQPGLTPEHNTPEHNTPEHNTPEHNTPEHNTPEHNENEDAVNFSTDDSADSSAEQGGAGSPTPASNLSTEDTASSSTGDFEELPNGDLPQNQGAASLQPGPAPQISVADGGPFPAGIPTDHPQVSNPFETHRDQRGGDGD